MAKNNQLYIPKQDIVDALNEVFNIQELLKGHYRSFDHHNKSDADLLDVCTRYLGKKIRTYTHNTPWDKGSIVAFNVAYEDYYDICLLGELNYCYSKFALCKELFHVIIDNPEFQSIDYGTRINQCIIGGVLLGPDSNEYVAEIAAMEYLFPFKDREAILKQTDIDFDTIALTYRIPRLLVETYLNELRMDSLRGCYMDSSFGPYLK